MGVICGDPPKYLTSRLPPFRVIKVIGTDTERSVTTHFLLVFHSHDSLIPYRFRDK